MKESQIPIYRTETITVKNDMNETYTWDSKQARIQCSEAMRTIEPIKSHLVSSLPKALRRCVKFSIEQELNSDSSVLFTTLFMSTDVTLDMFEEHAIIDVVMDQVRLILNYVEQASKNRGPNGFLGLENMGTNNPLGGENNDCKETAKKVLSNFSTEGTKKIQAGNEVVEIDTVRPHIQMEEDLEATTLDHVKIICVNDKLGYVLTDAGATEYKFHGSIRNKLLEYQLAGTYIKLTVKQTFKLARGCRNVHYGTILTVEPSSLPTPRNLL